MSVASVNSLCEVQIIDVAVLCESTHLKYLFLATRRDPRKFPASTAVAVLAFPSSYLKVPDNIKRHVFGAWVDKLSQQMRQKN